MNNGVFNQPKGIYDIKEDMKEKPAVIREVNKVEHERAFKPSNPGKKGRGGTLENVLLPDQSLVYPDITKPGLDCKFKS